MTRRVSRAPAAIEILPGIEAPLEVWRGLEIELLAALESEGPLPPDAAARRIRAQLYDWAERPCPASDPGRASQAMGAVLAGLDMILGRLVLPVPSDPSTEPAEARFFRERQEDVQRARAPGEPPPLEPDGAACLDLVLRSRLLGKRLVGGLPQAVGAHLVDAWIARRSAASGAGSDLRAVLPLWSRFALHGAARMVLERARPALTDLFLYT